MSRRRSKLMLIFVFIEIAVILGAGLLAMRFAPKKRKYLSHPAPRPSKDLVPPAPTPQSVQVTLHEGTRPPKPEDIRTVGDLPPATPRYDRLQDR